MFKHAEALDHLLTASAFTARLTLSHSLRPFASFFRTKVMYHGRVALIICLNFAESRASPS